MKNPESFSSPRLEAGRLVEYAGQVVAISLQTGSILMGAKDLNALNEAIQSSPFANEPYFAYGVPSEKDFGLVASFCG